MKRKISLLCVLLLVLAVILTACNNATPPETTIRWDKSEEYLYNISLADFEKAHMYSFNTYPYDGDVYGRDFRIQTNSALESAVTRELRPEQVKGTYHVTISQPDDGTYYELETEQVIYAQYKLTDLEKLAKWNDLQKRKADSAETEGMFENTDGLVVLKSTTDTYVKFENKKSQQPIESQTAVKGFYIGRTNEDGPLDAVDVNQYTVTAKYDFNAKTVTVNKQANESDQGEETTNNLSIAGNVNLIDSNQLFLYARSFDKSAAFQVAPSATVYNAYENKHYNASFALTLELKAVLSVDGEDKYVNKLSATSISLGTTGFMLQENLPNLAEKDVDTTTNPVNVKERIAKHTVVRFRVSHLAYELAEYPEGVIEAITAK